MSMGFVKSAYIKENFGGNKMFKKLKDKKGFTLVELIVVLVILAILAALLVPTLTGYIDKANKEKVVAETRMVVMAAQTEASSLYGKIGAGNDLSKAKKADLDAAAKEAISLAELSSESVGAYASLKANGEVDAVYYIDATYMGVYADKQYTVYKRSDIKANSTEDGWLKKASANAFKFGIKDSNPSIEGSAQIKPTTQNQ